MKYSWVFLVFLIQGCYAGSLEEVEMHEVTSRPYDGASFIIKVGANIGTMEIQLSRNNETAFLDSVKVNYSEIGTALVSNTLLRCIPNPIIEAPAVFFTAVGQRTDVPDDWFNSVRIPYYIDEPKMSTSDESMHIPMFPSVEFEFVGFKLNRIIFYRSATETRVQTDLRKSCQADLVQWAAQT